MEVAWWGQKCGHRAAGPRDFCVLFCRVTGGELFEDIVAREYYSEADARWVWSPRTILPGPSLTQPHSCPSAHVSLTWAGQMVGWAGVSVCPPWLSPLGAA